MIYASGIITFTFLSSGFSLYVISNLNLHYILHSSVAFMGFGISLFTRELLNTKEISKWIDNVIVISSILYLVLALLIIIDISFYFWISVLGLPTSLFAFFAGIFSMIKKSPLAKFYVFGMSGYLIGIFMFAGITLNVIPFNNISRYGFLLGSLIELIVFSLAIAYKVKILQDEKNIIQEKLLANEISMKNDLKIQVQERTHDLVEVGEELIAKNEELSIQVKEKNNAMDALKKTEVDLRQSNITKDKFFSIISHDLRGPFNALLGFSDILLSSHKMFDEEKRDHIIKSIHTSANNAYKLLENLLTWSRSQLKSINYLPNRIRLNTIMADTLLDIESQANTKNMKIINTLSENLTVYIDKNMIATVLRNLISNAIKFTEKTGKITISSYVDENNTIVSIADTGVGINKDQLEKLFDISVKTSTVGTDSETGTGLGLVLCKEFVENHGGKIWVESEIGIGSKFIFSIPNH